jgi:hypothetical protein
MQYFAKSPEYEGLKMSERNDRKLGMDRNTTRRDTIGMVRGLSGEPLPAETEYRLIADEEILKVLVILLRQCRTRVAGLGGPWRLNIHFRMLGLPTLRTQSLYAKGVGENLVQTPNPCRDAGRISCLETLSQIAGGLRAATRKAEILQVWLLQLAPVPKGPSLARAFSCLESTYSCT